MRFRRGQRVVDQRLGPLWFPATDRVIAPAIAREGIWEPSEGLWLDRHVRSGACVVNVGANVGYFSAWAADLVGPEGRIVAVEAHPDNHRFLVRNTRRRPNVTPVHAAAGTINGSIELFVNEENAGDHRVFPPDAARAADAAFADSSGGFRGEPERLLVPAVRLDDLLSRLDIGHVDVLFTDTQGHDHQVLAGAAGLLERDRPLILTEFAPAWIQAQGQDPMTVLEQWRRWGYRIGVWDAAIGPGDWSDERIIRWTAEPDRWFTNLELWPEERPLDLRVRAADGFWTVERDGPSERHWMVGPVGRIRVLGPAGSRGDVILTVAPGPSGPAQVTVDGQTASVGEPTTFRVPFELNERGRAEILIGAQSPPGRVTGDPRPLFAAVLDPAIAAAG